MMNIKKLLAALMALVMMLGCAGALAEEDNSLQAILDKGTLVMGLDDTFPPMGYREPGTDEIVGFDVDLARLVCEKLGVELVLQPIDWASKDLELNSGNIDCIWNGMSATPERQESMALSDTYMNNAMVLLVNNEAYQSRADLAGKVVGVQNGSTAEALLDGDCADFKATLSDVLGYDEYLTAIMDLQNGNLDAVLIDLVVAVDQISKLNDDSLFFIDNLADDLYAVGFRKEDVALRDKVNEIMAELAAEGKLTELSQQWFNGSDYSALGK